MQDYRTVNCYNKGRVEEDAGLSYFFLFEKV